jgi:hypothetical protein
VTIIDAEEIALAVVGVFNNFAIGQGFSYESSGVVTRVAGNQLTAIVAVLSFLQQLAV